MIVNFQPLFGYKVNKNKSSVTPVIMEQCTGFLPGGNQGNGNEGGEEGEEEDGEEEGSAHRVSASCSSAPHGEG